jgi:cytochrome bd-type quinol oxidase subunit 2
MKDIWFHVPRILGLVIMLAALSLLGLGNPKMIPVFAVFFAVLFAVIYLLNLKGRKKDKEAVSGSVFSSLLRYLGVLVFLAALTLMGLGNPSNLPFFALFFLIVFAVVFLLVRNSRLKERSDKSGSTVMVVFQILGLALFVGALSLMGLLHGVVGYLIWLLVITAIFALVFMFVRKQQNHSETTEASPLLKKVFGVVLAILSVILPYLIIKNGQIMDSATASPATQSVISILAILVFIVLALLAYNLIRKANGQHSKRLLGYILLILAAVLPGIMVMLTDPTKSGFAQAYFAALMAMVLSVIAIERFKTN